MDKGPPYVEMSSLGTRSVLSAGIGLSNNSTKINKILRILNVLRNIPMPLTCTNLLLGVITLPITIPAILLDYLAATLVYPLRKG